MSGICLNSVLQIVYLLALNVRIKNDGKFMIPLGLMYHTKLGLICLPFRFFFRFLNILTDFYLPLKIMTPYILNYKVLK